MNDRLSRRDFLGLAAIALGSTQLPNLSIASAGERSIDGIVERTEEFKIGDTTIKANLFQNKRFNSDITYFNMHENEQVSVRAAKYIVRAKGGRLIYLKHNDTREIAFHLYGEQYRFDPNRIFTDGGIKRTLRHYGNYSKAAFKKVKEFRDWLLRTYSLDNSKVMVAVHNNTNNNYSISSYLKGSPYASDAKKVHQEAGQDTDDFFFVTKDIDFNHFSRLRFNVVLQDNGNVKDDGSLSVYWSKKSTSYINVEVQNNRAHLKQQIRMLMAVHQFYQSNHVKEKGTNSSSEHLQVAQEPTPQHRVYTVTEDDSSFWKIVREQYGRVNWDMINRIRQYNVRNGTSFNPNVIRHGQKIYLPKLR